MKLLIISDIHANWPALLAVLHAEPDIREILCLGDLVDYGPQPLRCVEWSIRSTTCFWIGILVRASTPLRITRLRLAEMESR